MWCLLLETNRYVSITIRTTGNAKIQLGTESDSKIYSFSDKKLPSEFFSGDPLLCLVKSCSRAYSVIMHIYVVCFDMYSSGSLKWTSASKQKWSKDVILVHFAFAFALSQSENVTHAKKNCGQDDYGSAKFPILMRCNCWKRNTWNNGMQLRSKSDTTNCASRVLTCTRI